MTDRTTLYTKADVPAEDVDGESCQAIVDMQYNAPFDVYVANAVRLPRNSQGEDNVPIFDAKSTGLYFMRSMWRRKQTFCALGTDGIIGVQAVSWIKLLLFDSSCPYLQRLFASFLPIYAGGRTLFLNRFTSDCMIINEALESVGKRINSKTELVTNGDLYREKVFMVVFDSNWSVNNGVGLGPLPGELDSALIDTQSLPGFHSVYPNDYFEFGLPGSKLRYKKD